MKPRPPHAEAVDSLLRATAAQLAHHDPSIELLVISELRDWLDRAASARQRPGISREQAEADALTRHFNFLSLLRHGLHPRLLRARLITWIGIIAFGGWIFFFLFLLVAGWKIALLVPAVYLALLAIAVAFTYVAEIRNHWLGNSIRIPDIKECALTLSPLLPFPDRPIFGLWRPRLGGRKLVEFYKGEIILGSPSPFMIVVASLFEEKIPLRLRDRLHRSLYPVPLPPPAFVKPSLLVLSAAGFLGSLFIALNPEELSFLRLSFLALAWGGALALACWNRDERAELGIPDLVSLTALFTLGLFGGFHTLMGHINWLLILLPLLPLFFLIPLAAIFSTRRIAVPSAAAAACIFLAAFVSARADSASPDYVVTTPPSQDRLMDFRFASDAHSLAFALNNNPDGTTISVSDGQSSQSLVIGSNYPDSFQAHPEQVFSFLYHYPRCQFVLVDGVPETSRSELVSEVIPLHAADYRQTQVSPSGRYLVGIMKNLDSDSDIYIHDLALDLNIMYPNFFNPQISFSPDEEKVLVWDAKLDDEQTVLQFWELSSEKNRRRMIRSWRSPHEIGIYGFSANGRMWGMILHVEEHVVSRTDLLLLDGYTGRAFRITPSRELSKALGWGYSYLPPPLHWDDQRGILAVVLQNHLLFIGPEGIQRRLPLPANINVASLSISPDASRAVFAGFGSENIGLPRVYLLNLHTEEFRRLAWLNLLSAHFPQFRWADDSTRVAVSSIYGDYALMSDGLTFPGPAFGYRFGVYNITK